MELIRPYLKSTFWFGALALLSLVPGIEVEASGTFIYPPPPKVNVVLDDAELAMGKKIFENDSKGVSCKSCHGKTGKKKFRRRKLARVINKLSKKANQCQLAEDRMHQEMKLQDKELKALRVFLAKEYRLLDYLR